MGFTPLINASSRPLNLNPGTLPDMTDVLTNFFQPMTFTQITKAIVNSLLTETQTQINTSGTRQALSPQQLALKPEGQRAWRWQQIHTWPNVILSPDDIIIFGPKSYRVMAKIDHTEYGYLEYHVVEDYTP